MRAGDTAALLGCRSESRTSLDASRAVYAPPDHADLRALDRTLCAVNVCDALQSPVFQQRQNVRHIMTTYLPEVELRILLRGDTLNLEEGGVGASVALGALVAKDTAL